MGKVHSIKEYRDCNYNCIHLITSTRWKWVDRLHVRARGTNWMGGPWPVWKLLRRANHMPLKETATGFLSQAARSLFTIPAKLEGMCRGLQVSGVVTLNNYLYFRVCKSVLHHTFNWIDQPDAANSQVYYLSFKYSSTCFGHPHAHHQDLQQLQQQPLVYCRSVVITVLLAVVGPAGPTTTNSTVITKLQR
jgi:hypothetical protein